jgi:DNA-binding response OmpR family regulator
VIQVALDRRGVNTVASASPAEALRSAQLHAPDVIVLDIESLPGSNTSCNDFVLSAKASNGSLLVVGDAPKRTENRPVPGDRIAKPYHYATLVNKIEGLLTLQKTNRSRLSSAPEGLRKAA